jgi:tetratricopeptide (TPR) repeat protein
VLYMMGQMENSIKSANEALRIDGRNFQALAGIGLIEMDASHYDKAIESFRRCLSINPWMGTVSSRLSVCLSKKDNGSKLPYDADSWINIQDKEDPRERMGVQWPWEHDKEKST